MARVAAAIALIHNFLTGRMASHTLRQIYLELLAALRPIATPFGLITNSMHRLFPILNLFIRTGHDLSFNRGTDVLAELNRRVEPCRCAAVPNIYQRFYITHVRIKNVAPPIEPSDHIVDYLFFAAKLSMPGATIEGVSVR